MTPPGDDETDSPTDVSDGLGDIPDTDRQHTPPQKADDETSLQDEKAINDEKTQPVESALADEFETEYAAGERGQGQGDNAEGETPNEWVLLGRDVAISVLAVALIGTYLFAISGVWPPMVAIESGSMEPNMNENDLVFVMESDRFQPDIAAEAGIVSAHEGEEHDYTKFNEYGDVIVYAPNGNTEQTPIIHRAMFWVDEGDDWVEKANEDHLGSVEDCEDVESVCPAPNDGFITKGDNERTNQVYDQVNGEQPVHPEWVMGTAEVRVPGIGWLRLQFE